MKDKLMENRFYILAVCIVVLLIILIIVSVTDKGIPKLSSGEEVVVSIKDKEFTADDLYKELKGTYGYEKIISMIDIYIANQEIEDSKEINDYAKQVVEYYTAYAKQYELELGAFLESYVGLSGIKTEADFLQYIINDYKVSLAVQKHIGAAYTSDEIKNYYDKNYSELLTVRHILIEIEDSDKDGSNALATANKLIAELKKAEDIEAKFIELAKEYSDDSSYSTGGLISDMMSSTVVSEFWNASYKLKDGEYTAKAVKTDYGYHIIYRKSIAAKPALEASESNIRAAMAEKALADDELLIYVAMAELRDKYKIKIYDTDIKESYNTFLNSLKAED